MSLCCRGTAVGETNVQGEDQKKLDVIANDLFINMLKSSFEAYNICAICAMLCSGVGGGNGIRGKREMY